MNYHFWLRGCVGAETIYETQIVLAAFDTQGRVLVARPGGAGAEQLPAAHFELADTFDAAARRALAGAGALDAAVQGLVGVYSHPRWSQNGAQPWAVCLWAEVEPSANTAFARPESLRLSALQAAMLNDALRARAGDGPALEPPEAAPPVRPYWSLLRRFVGHAPLILPGGSAAIEDASGHILAVQRADLGCWQLPGGLADLGETTTAAILREVEEETGLWVEPYAVVGVYSVPELMTITVANGDVVRGVDLILACRVVGGRLNPAGNDTENTCAAFVTVETLLTAGCWNSTAVQVRDYLNRDGWPFVR